MLVVMFELWLVIHERMLVAIFSEIERKFDSRKLNNRLATVLQIRPFEVFFSIFETFSKLPNLPVFRHLIQPNTLTTLFLPPTLCVRPGSSTGRVFVLHARGSEIEPRRVRASVGAGRQRFRVRASVVTFPFSSPNLSTTFRERCRMGSEGLGGVSGGKTTISEGFPTTFRRCSEDFRRVSDDDQRGCRRFPKMFRRFPEDFPRGSDDFPKISRRCFQVTSGPGALIRVLLPVWGT